MNPLQNNEDKVYSKIVELLSNARKEVVKQINQTMVYTYYEIGRIIVEYEQDGQERAEYGQGVLASISKKLSNGFGKGFSIDNLENMRKFFLTYSKSETLSRKSDLPEFQLSWSHYLKLIRIIDTAERKFLRLKLLRISGV